MGIQKSFRKKNLNYLQKKLSQCLPPIKVHSWGGFGSQLFTAHLALRLKRRFPHRGVNVSIHTSGVTRRNSEFNFEAIGIKSCEINDFEKKAKEKVASTSSPRTQVFLHLYRKVFKFFIMKLHLLEDCNTEESFTSIRPWTMVIRGHYTRLQLESDSVNDIFKALFCDLHLDLPESGLLVIHYRLGDLLTLQDKSPMAPERIESLVESIQLNANSRLVLTDSYPSAYRDFVSGFETLVSLPVENLDPIEAIWLCSSSDFFVGTNTKLSIWAEIFRDSLFRNPGYLPLELEWARDIGVKANWY